MTYFRLLAVSSLVLVGCQDAIDLDPLDNTPPIEARVRPAPILGGTLTLTADDSLAIAADPDRDLVHIVDLDAHQVLHTIALAPGDQPQRVVLGSNGQAHVVLRGAGAIATIDPVAGTVTARHAVCLEPRGIAFHDADASLYVACAGGSLLHLTEAGEVLERRELEPDLRDVVIVDGEVKVSLFRSAAIIGLDGSRLEIPHLDGDVPHVAWRTWVTGAGDIAILHQMESTRPVPIDPEPDDLEDSAPYGGGGGFCQLGIVNAAITTIAKGRITTTPLTDSNLTVDAAFSPDGRWMAMAVPGVIRPEDRVEKSDKRSSRNELDSFPAVNRPSVQVDPRPDGGVSCNPTDDATDYGQVTAVAFAASGRLVMQSREPARIMVMEEAPGGALETIALAGEPRFDTGHEIFHRATDSGLSCASCHPEGTDDGHIWDFKDLGPRRTQALDVGLVDTAPYHWDGDMPDFGVLMAEVLAHRMGGKRQSPARGDSFTRWMFEQQRPAAASDVADPTIVAAGEALFADYGCKKCHDGPALGGQRTERIAGADKQVPTLRRISLHPPFMHDGRAPTLEAAVRDMVTTTRSTPAPEADIAAMAAYLRTL
ncbi:MAG: c-type cytochrome [Nannocystis sp.]|nr:c-type cytochrome [Nannocystis sp.]MBA3545935.1 c-type cytochrome [Nannocystis sp.]